MNMSNNNFREEIRSIIQEEISSPRNASASTTRSLLQRTREMINQSTTSAVNILSSQVPLSQRNLGNSLRSVPGHRDRLSSGKKRKIDDKDVTLEMTLLCKCDDDLPSTSDNSYTLTEPMIAIKHLMINLKPSYGEDEVRTVIVQSLVSRFPFINENNFDFVKRDRNLICTPCTGDHFRWNYTQVKKLCGQGKLYVRLNVDISTIYHPQSNTNQNASQVVVSANSEAENSEAATSQNRNDEEILENRNDKEILENLFPDLQKSEIARILEENPTIEAAADAAAEYIESKNDTLIASAEDLLKILGKKMKPHHQTFRIDEEFLVTDAFRYFKDKKFDASLRLRVIFQNQPAVDAGGLLRHFFTSLFKELSDPFKSSRLFEGNSKSQLPICRTETAISEIFVHVGIMMAYSVLHGIRPLCLSESIYRYLVSGTIQDALPYLSVEDVATEMTKHFIKEISNASERRLLELAGDAELGQLLEEAGEFVYLSKNNKDKVLQSLIIHDVLVKRKVSLDHLRKGLKTNGLLDLMTENPEVAKTLFLYCEEYDGITPDAFVKIVDFSEMKPEQRTMFVNVINQMTKEQLKNLLVFCTGVSDFFSLRSAKIEVEFKDEPGIFASTCTYQLSVPSTALQSEELLTQILTEHIIPTNGRAFNTL